MGSLAEKMAKEKERIAKQDASRGSYEKINWFKPELNVDTMIRILPAKKADDFPFVTVKIHYIGKELDSGKTINIPARCRQDFEEECPVCDAAQKAIKGKNKDLYNKLRAKETHLYNILDYKAREVKPWAAGMTIHKAVIDNFGDIVEIFDLEGGRDWKVLKSQDPKKKGPLGITYSMRPAPKDSDVPEKYSPLIDEALDLKSLYGEDATAEMEAFVETLDFDAEVDDEPIDKSRFKKSVKNLKSRDEEEEEEEDDIPENKLSSKAKAAAAAAKAKSKSRHDDEDEEDEEEEEIKPKAKVKAKPVVEDDDEEEEERPKAKSKKRDMDYEDEDLEKEMDSLIKKNKKSGDDDDE